MVVYRVEKCVDVEFTWIVVLLGKMCNLRFSLNWLWRMLRDIWVYSKDGGSKLLGNIDIYIPIYMSLHPHKLKTSSSLVWKPQISHWDYCLSRCNTLYRAFQNHVPDHRSCCWSYITNATWIHEKMRVNFPLVFNLPNFIEKFWNADLWLPTRPCTFWKNMWMHTHYRAVCWNTGSCCFNVVYQVLHRRTPMVSHPTT